LIRTPTILPIPRPTHTYPPPGRTEINCHRIPSRTRPAQGPPQGHPTPHPTPSHPPKPTHLPAAGPSGCRPRGADRPFGTKGPRGPFARRARGGRATAGACSRNPASGQADGRRTADSGRTEGGRTADIGRTAGGRTTDSRRTAGGRADAAERVHGHAPPPASPPDWPGGPGAGRPGGWNE
jgi:hypothetical protein